MKSVPAINLPAYRKTTSHTPFFSWLMDDARTGTTTVSTIGREGLLDMPPIPVITPAGWTWWVDLYENPSMLVYETSAT